MRIGYDGKRAVQNFTGLGNYSRYVIEALQKYYPDNEYFLYAPKPRVNSRLSFILEKGNRSVSMHYPLSAKWKKLSALWRIKGIRENLERDQLDLFHGLSNELPLNIKKVKSIKSIVTIHDLIFLRLPYCYSFIDRKIYNYKFNRACQNADHIIAVSECTKADIVHFYGIPQEKISVIYQGCDPVFSIPATRTKKEEVCNRYQLPKHYILSVGTIEKRKNTLSIVKALCKLPKHIHLVLIGKSTSYSKTINEFIDKSDLQGRVHLLHNIPFADLPAIYQLADTFVYPSIYEGFGIPILEALNSGIPVVAATGSCLEEAGGKYSLYTAPYDVEAMANAIKQSFIPETRTRMIEEGVKWAQQFSQKQMAVQTIDCYNRVLHNH